MLINGGTPGTRISSELKYIVTRKEIENIESYINVYNHAIDMITNYSMLELDLMDENYDITSRDIIIKYIDAKKASMLWKLEDAREYIHKMHEQIQ